MLCMSQARVQQISILYLANYEEVDMYVMIISCVFALFNAYQAAFIDWCLVRAMGSSISNTRYFSICDPVHKPNTTETHLCEQNVRSNLSGFEIANHKQFKAMVSLHTLVSLLSVACLSAISGF